MALRILVTGASGFIGKPLVSTLVAEGHRVRAAARQMRSAIAGVEAVELSDITQPVNWASFVAGMDVVIHLAGIAHRRAGESTDYDQANRGATADLAAACKAAKVKRLIFVSSIAAQTGSASDDVLTEADEPRPVTDYDRAKLAAEDAVRRSGVGHTILRPVVVYGPDPKANIALMTKLAALPVPLPFGAFQNRRSLLAIDNIISAVMHCMEDKRTLNQTFVVADQEPITLAAMLTVMRRANGRRANLLPVPPLLFKFFLAMGGQLSMWDRIGRELVVDPQKLRDAGWHPKVTTVEGLTAMVRQEATRLP